VSDLIDGIYKLMMSDYAMPVNIGNPEELTMLELAKEIIAMTNSKSKIIFKELPTDDPKIRQPNITKARTILGWEPKVQRSVGLKRTIEYFKTKI
jgi:dTDP-glucose 4,6-dehydratase